MSYSRQTSSVSTPAPAALTQSTGSYELVFSGVIVGLLGLVLDRALGTTPVFLLVFTILGFVGASLSLYYRYQHEMKSNEQAQTEDGVTS